MSAITPYVSTATCARVMSALAKGYDAGKAATEYTHWLPDFVDQGFKAIFGDAYTSYAEEDQIKQEFANAIATSYKELKSRNYSSQGHNTSLQINKESFTLVLSADNTLSLHRHPDYPQGPLDFGIELARHRFNEP